MESKTFLVGEVVLRIVIIIFFYISDDATPFFRKIQPEEFWLYRFPRTPSYYPGNCLWATILGVPTLTILIVFIIKRDKQDMKQAFLGAVLSVFLTGSVTNCIKLAVGRPRPDFLDRCFPGGVGMNEELECTGSAAAIIQGRKSFPSGHSSFAFSGLGFVALYLAGKLHCFTREGRGQTWRLCVVVVMLLWACLIAASRTADYHHHWQDVTVGSVLGMLLAYVCYRQYYPSILIDNSHLPYISLTQDHLDNDRGAPLLPRTFSAEKMDSMLKIV